MTERECVCTPIWGKTDLFLSIHHFLVYSLPVSTLAYAKVSNNNKKQQY